MWNKRKLVMCFLLFFVTVLLAPSVQAIAQDLQGQITGRVVNVRKGPSTQYGKLDQVKKGQVVTILEKQGEWYKINMGGQIGWVTEEYVQVSSSPSNKANNVGTINADVVNVRQGIGTQTPVVFKVHKGQNVNIIKEENGWCFIKTNQGSGWVARWLLSVPGQSSSRLATVTGSIVNVRENPGTQYRIVDKVKKGENVEIINQKGEWYQIENENGKQGWVAAELLSLASKPADNNVDSKPASPNTTETVIEKPTSAYTVVVTGNVVNIRQQPSTSSSVVAQVKAGTSLTVVAQNNDWLKARLLDGREGWIAGWLTEEKSVNTGIDIASNKVKFPLGNSVTLTINNLGNNLYLELTPLNNEKYQLSRATSGNRLIIQVSDSKLNDIKQPINNWGIQNIQVEKNIIVVNFDRDFEYQSDYKSGDKLLQVKLIYPKDGLIPVKRIFLSPQRDSSVVQIATQGKATYTTKQLAPNKIAIDLQPGNLDLASQDQMEQQVAYGPIRKVTSRQLAPDLVRIETELVAGAKYNVTQQDGYIVLGAKLTSQPGSLRGKTIVLDPGHGEIRPGGWIAPGAIGRILKIREVDVNLDVALKVRDLLQQAGAHVVMTHTTGRTYLTLEGRGNLASKVNADIFVSIHSNSSTNTATNGTSVYFYAPLNDPNYLHLAAQREERKRLATCLQRELVNIGQRRNIGVLENRYVVLKENNVPSALVEMAFLSNPEEERLLSTNAFRNKMAIGIFNGIKDYFAGK